ncbi:MAG: hypothetical protein WKF75_15700 [Singulisphaera sp.]
MGDRQRVAEGGGAGRQTNHSHFGPGPTLAEGPESVAELEAKLKRFEAEMGEVDGASQRRCGRLRSGRSRVVARRRGRVEPRRPPAGSDTGPALPTYV